MNKKVRKISAFDIAVIGIVILAIGFGCFYFYKQQSKRSKCDVTFTVEFTGVAENFIKSIIDAPSRSDEIKDSVKGYYLGNAVDVKVETDKVVNLDVNEGKFVEVETPGKYTAYLTVKGNGVETDTSILCEGQVIRVGSKISLKGEGYAQSGFITALETNPKGGDVK